MVPEVANNPLIEILDTLSEQLRAAKEERWASRLAALAKFLRDSPPGTVSYQKSVRDILRLFDSGMGGLQDIVLQNEDGPLPQQGDFDSKRNRLFREALRQLR